MSDEREPARSAGTVQRLVRRIRAVDSHAPTVRTLQVLRRYGPGGNVADVVPAGGRPSDRLARLIAEVATEQPSITRELGLTAVQLWQAAASRSHRGRHGHEPGLTIVFTDLVNFSEWALRAGDEQVLRLLRAVNRASEQAITARGGSVVKSLGDGLMVVFADTAAAVGAAEEACTAVSALTLEGYRPQLRVGMHRGQPSRVRGDYLGVDVNVAARVAGEASGGEILISGPALAELDTRRYSVRRRRRFRAKGTPKDLEVYSIVPRHSIGARDA